MRNFTIIFFVLFYAPAFATEPEILINSLLSQRMHLHAGDSVQIAASGDMKNAVTFRIKAIYSEKADPYNVPLKRSVVKMHLPDLEKLTGRTDQVDLISLTLRKGEDARTIAARLNSEAIGFTAYSANELARKSSTTFEVVSRFHQAIALITMMAGAIFIFALVVMRVEDQRKSLAILSVTGISRSTILKSLVLESMFFAFFASLLGAGLGIISAAAVNIYYQHYYQTTLIFARVTPAILLRAILLSFLFGLVAGTFSWFRLRRLAILEELGR
jgi:putative ABC transport system permease protein